MVADFRALRTEMRRRTKVIRDIADKQPARCPENKVTPELASDQRLGLHPIAAAIDECQVAFEHPVYGGGDGSDLHRPGQARPGARHADHPRHAAARRQVASRPASRANAVLRFCLKVLGQIENDMVLGTSQYKRGHPRHACSGSTTRACCTSAARACARASSAPSTSTARWPRSSWPAPAAMREAAGRLTGYALGEDGDQETRSLAADVLMVFGDDDKLWLRDHRRTGCAARFPRPTPTSPRTPSRAMLRALGIEVKQVREPRQAAAARMRAGSRRGSRGRRRCVTGDRRMCSASRNTRRPAHFRCRAEQPERRSGAAGLRCSAVPARNPDLSLPAAHGGREPMSLRPQLNVRVRPLRQAPRPVPRVRVQQPPQADPQAHGDVREMPELQEDHQRNPLTHVCAPRSDFKRRKASPREGAAGQRPAKKRPKNGHDYTDCADNDCPRSLCVAFKTGWKRGHEAATTAAGSRATRPASRRATTRASPTASPTARATTSKETPVAQVLIILGAHRRIRRCSCSPAREDMPALPRLGRERQAPHATAPAARAPATGSASAPGSSTAAPPRATATSAAGRRASRDDPDQDQRRGRRRPARRPGAAHVPRWRRCHGHRRPRRRPRRRGGGRPRRRGYLLYRARRPGAQNRTSASPATLRAEVLPVEPRPAIAPVVRLPADQLAELAEILRRQQAEQ